MNKIQELRLAANMSQKELGTAVDLTQAAISLYELGKRLPNLRISRKIVNVFRAKGVECTIDDFAPEV